MSLPLGRCLVLTALVAGCAGPPYQADNARNPPADPEAVAASPHGKEGALPQAGTGSIDDEAREQVRASMFAHGQNMEALLWSSLMLQYGTTKRISDWLAAQAAIEPENAASLPSGFLEIRRELRESAELLSAAAAKSDGEGVAAAYGQLSEVCVRCHARYLWTKR